MSTLAVPIEHVSAEFRATYHDRLVAWYRTNFPREKAPARKVAELVSLGYLPCDDRGDTLFGKLDIARPLKGGA